MPNISKYLRLSTAQIPERLSNRLGRLDAHDGVIAYHYPEGAWLWVPDDVNEHLETSGYTPHLHVGFTSRVTRCIPDIETLWRQARGRGCDFIHLDPGAGPEPDLRTYLRLSTGHIPERLINGPGGLNAVDGVSAHQYPEGAWLLVPADIDEHLKACGYTPAADAKQIRKTTDDAREWPRSLDEVEPLWRYAHSLGCDFIRLDTDEDVDPQIRVYDWEYADIFKRPCLKHATGTPSELTYAEWAADVVSDSAEAARLAEGLLEGSDPPEDTPGSAAGKVEVSDREALVAQFWVTQPEAARKRLRELEGEGEFRDIPVGHVDRLAIREVAVRLAELYLAEADGSDDLPAAAPLDS